MIRAKSQYLPPDEKTNLETSYSATFRGEQAKLQPTDNKALERRRIRSLYSEPYIDPTKQVRQHSVCHLWGHCYIVENLDWGLVFTQGVTSHVCYGE